MIKVGALHCYALPVLLNLFFKSYVFIQFSTIFIIMSTSKFNLKYYAFHGHEKTHDNFLISMLVDKEKG
jgi:hypothetical protein